MNASVCRTMARARFVENAKGSTNWRSWVTLVTGNQKPGSVRSTISGWWYVFGDECQTGDIVLALDVGDFPAPGVDGFRLLAHTTPMNGNQIKTNEELAQASEGGLKRLGVLRMDVDNLGDLVVRGLPARTAMQTAGAEPGAGAVLRRLAGSHLRPC